MAKSPLVADLKRQAKAAGIRGYSRMRKAELLNAVGGVMVVSFQKKTLADFRCDVVGNCTLYLGDCSEVLPLLPKVNAVVTDWPYGIGEASKNFASRGKLASADKYERSQWDDKPIDDALVDVVLKAGRWQVLFGGNYYALPPTSCWLVWDKLNGDSDFADCELAWTNLPKAVRRIRFLWNGMLRRERDIAREHPTQKPVDVMKWCIEHIPEPSQTILDPFMGSGTTGVACVKLGRKFIGIEREPKYFEIACRRIREAYAQPDFLITPPEPQPKQMNILEGL